MSLPFLATYKGDAFYEILHIVLLDYVPFIGSIGGALHGGRRDLPGSGSLRGTPIAEHGDSFYRHGAGQLDGDDGRGDAAHSADSAGKRLA